MAKAGFHWQYLNSRCFHPFSLRTCWALDGFKSLCLKSRDNLSELFLSISLHLVLSFVTCPHHELAKMDGDFIALSYLSTVWRCSSNVARDARRNGTIRRATPVSTRHLRFIFWFLIFTVSNLCLLYFLIFLCIYRRAYRLRNQSNRKRAEQQRGDLDTSGRVHWFSCAYSWWLSSR